MNDLISQFKNPSSLFRGKPFWAWNGKLNEPELRRQIRIMHRMGLGGFFMHSRVGLATEYLSDEFLQLVEACCDEAKKLDMQAWLYDEDRWPSGAAGGLVTKDPRYRQRRLQMDVLTPQQFQWNDDLLRVFTARLEDHNAYDVAPLEKNRVPLGLPDDHNVITFRVITVKPSPWFNDRTYLDTLSHEAVQRFIEVTHEQYKQKIGACFGNVVPGIFTDEPNHGSTCDQELVTNPENEVIGLASSWIPWTESLPQTFKQRYGYDLLDHLPAVFFDIEALPVQQPRHHYHDCKTFLFVDAFARQIGSWCQANNLMFTGHVLMESPLSIQTSLVGAAMRFYEHMQAPGIDILTENHAVTKPHKEYDTAKQCSSVQHQTGRKWMLSELYGCTGWDFPFEGHKAVGDWQTALGVNLRCQHLSWYTMQSQAKRDYPASIFYQSPWWDQYRTVEDYFARLGAVMSRGAAVRNLLVVHPIESSWQVCKFNWSAGQDPNAIHPPLEFDDTLANLRDWLLEAHIDFDYGDEEMLARLASVRPTNAGPQLVVGQAIYNTMLFPALLTVRSSTLELARKFREAGGKVIFAGPPPDFVDALPAKAAQTLARQCTRARFRRTEVVRAAETAREISLCNTAGKEIPDILYLLHAEGENHYLFLCNTNRQKAHPDVTLRIKSPTDAPAPQEWDPATSEIYAADCQRDGQQLLIKTNFPPSGSRLFVFPEKPADKQLSHRPSFGPARAQNKLTGRWQFSLSEPNVLVLDNARFRIAADGWQQSAEVLRIDHAIRDCLGITQRGGSMVQPWAQQRDTQQKTTPVEMGFEFKVAHLPQGPVELAIERPSRFQISINGHKVSSAPDNGWWTDKSLRRLPVDAALLHKGRNELHLSLEYNADDGIEAVFLLGDFGVELDENRPIIVAMPRTLRATDWIGQGLPFYSGTVTYCRTVTCAAESGERVMLELPKWAGACVRVSVDGQPIKTLGWPPYRVDLTDAITTESFELGIEVYSHRHNSFGPLHLACGGRRPGWVGPAEFITTDDLWQDNYDLTPCGLLTPPILHFLKQL